jgi:hypothetical protein
MEIEVTDDPQLALSAHPLSAAPQNHVAISHQL